MARSWREKGVFWTPWVARSAAVSNLVAAVMSFLLLSQGGGNSFGSRMYSIGINEVAFRWSWGVSILSVLGMTSVFFILLWFMDSQYRGILQMAFMIWIIGASGWVLHDLIQIRLMPLLSQWFLATPTGELATYIRAWEELLFRFIGIFGLTCYAISGLIYTAVMFRTKDVPIVMSRYFFVVWCFVLAIAVSAKWLISWFPWLIICTLLLLVPWFWRLSKLLPRPGCQ
ncbi:hypothetical protein SAMN05444487_106116 [Marininema mesophilum]|uniref:Uncharacterized protein n=1 Tax=Marininema mesophilum TaxID=1048340 RepID=A0A1H2WFJ6_9BACL|nr:hypothetical protein [Marininema mesophilum]SDW79380.1 hypothetical protein SAMN05444487_106116 [Marininema mesophilum]